MFIGKPAPEALALLVSSLPEIENVQFISYRPGLKWAGLYTLIAKQVELGIAEVRRFSRESILKSDFWDKQLEDLKKVEVPKDSPFSAEGVERWYREDDDLEESVYIAFSSAFGFMVDEAKRTRIIRHIPLMDFRVSPSEENLAHVKDLLREKGEQAGVILDSGMSYHYYGLKTLLPSEWREWMKSWYWTLADNFYIATAMSEGHNWLRLTSGVTKPEVPKVVDVI